jgi:hypothetical protein
VRRWRRAPKRAKRSEGGKGRKWRGRDGMAKGKKPRTYREPSFYPIREVVVKGGSFRFGKVGVK